MKTVTIVDYSVGNLLSVSRAFEASGSRVIVTSQPDEIINAERLVLPGVGAFSRGMELLNGYGLVDPIKEYALSGRPMLGICLGMQFLFDYSEEFGRTEGLSLIPGHVAQIPTHDVDNKKLKIPHIGWNNLSLPEGCSHEFWRATLFKNNSPNDAVYFVHSFAAQPDSPSNLLSSVDYGGNLITAAAYKDNIWGCQFHPEKSGLLGLKMIDAILTL